MNKEDKFDADTISAIRLINECLEINQVQTTAAIMAMTSLSIVALKKVPKKYALGVINAMMGAIKDEGK